MTNPFGVNEIWQGDVVLRRIDKVPDKAIEEGEKIEGTIVLALGEATGHSHVVVETEPGTLTSYRLGDITFVVPEADVIVEHDDHHNTPLAAGTVWQVEANGQEGSIREMDHFANEVRQLRD